MPDHTNAIKLVLNCLTDAENGVVKSLEEIHAVGHRVVHEMCIRDSSYNQLTSGESAYTSGWSQINEGEAQIAEAYATIAENEQKLADGWEAVSYTHLSMGIKEAFEEEFAAKGGEIVASEAFTGGDVDFNTQLTTVSYTHLDVYKRQLESSNGVKLKFWHMPLIVWAARNACS